MNKEKRRILTDDEKYQLLEKYKNCYICQKPLKGYDLNEIEFDHIYSYTSGSTQDLNNFAPVHASKNNDKLNCHKEKGRKKPVEYREELRIKNQLKSINSLKDIRKDALPSDYEISENKKNYF